MKRKYVKNIRDVKKALRLIGELGKLMAESKTRSLIGSMSVEPIIADVTSIHDLYKNHKVIAQTYKIEITIPNYDTKKKNNKEN